MCSSWTAEPLVVDTQCQDEIQPLCATLEVAPSFGTASWQSPMSSFTFLCACETRLGSGSLSCCAESRTRAFSLLSFNLLSFTPKAQGTAQPQSRPGLSKEFWGPLASSALRLWLARATLPTSIPEPPLDPAQSVCVMCCLTQS